MLPDDKKLEKISNEARKRKNREAVSNSALSAGLSISGDKELLDIALRYGYLILVPTVGEGTLDFVIKPALGEDREYLKDRGY